MMGRYDDQDHCSERSINHPNHHLQNNNPSKRKPPPPHSSQRRNHNRNHNNHHRNNHQTHSSSSSSSRSRRIVLLLDLDCFYAQCECIRLGFDSATTALALLQWNSVLAVTYPARTRFGVQRGDSWHTIRQKVAAAAAIAAATTNNQHPTTNPTNDNGHDHPHNKDDTCCYAIHVPLLTTQQVQDAAVVKMNAIRSNSNSSLGITNNDNENNNENKNNKNTATKPPPIPLYSQQQQQQQQTAQTASTALWSLQEEYNAMFQLSPAQQEACRRAELGVRRLSFEGKASIERYRIASARIFQVVQEFIHAVNQKQSAQIQAQAVPATHNKNRTIILERASIDEFFLDVTLAVQDKAVWQQQQQQPPNRGDQKKNNNINNHEDQQGTCDSAETPTWSDSLVQQSAKQDTKLVGGQDNSSSGQDDAADNNHNNSNSGMDNLRRRFETRTKDNHDDGDYNDDEEDVLLGDYITASRSISDHVEQPDDWYDNNNDDDDDDDADVLLWRGAAIAWAIRQHVYDTLGFTLTAGIGTNKTLAKLTASYGKPNGQAMTLPRHIPTLLRQTPIAKCRNLGGKLGQQVVQALTKTTTTTMTTTTTTAKDKKNNGPSFSVACIARHLSLPALRRALGSAETAQWVFELSAYGVDREPVASKKQTEDGFYDGENNFMGNSRLSSSSSSSAATKSLTAFKSLPNSRAGVGHSIVQASPWIHLLATDLITRVQRDANRNGRFPKTCTLHYTKLLPQQQRHEPQQPQQYHVSPQQQYSGSDRVPVDTQSKSVRVDFPSQVQQQQQGGGAAVISASTTEAAIQALCQSTANALRQKEGGAVQLTRLGFTATDFVQRHNKGIDHYFSSSASSSSSGNNKTGANADGLTTTAWNRPVAAKQSTGLIEEIDLTETVDKDNPAGGSASGRAQTNGQSDPSQPRDPAQQLGIPGTAADADKDLALAKKLQAQYDREDKAWSRLGCKQQKKKPRLRTIDSFFSSAK
ncbi:hypothetical protein ACA910_001505 [Epithemia clementina (nom. ined.)]